MVRKHVGILVLILCLGCLLIGCPKKAMVKEEASVKNEGAVSKGEAERAKEMKAEGENNLKRVSWQERNQALRGRSLKANFLKTFTSTLINTISVLEMHLF